ncbi:MAG: hypothetical protein JO264_03775, partial [Acidisphaera sp.]|nr:hypothetical protein [Acidisphaera sp.]
MSNNVQTLSGGEFANGAATDNSQTDQFAVYGADNVIEENGGNLTVVGEADPGFKPKGNYDTATTIYLGSANGNSSPANQTTDTITLDGSGNSVLSGPYSSNPDLGHLYKSTISITLTGKGPQGSTNAVDSTYNNIVELVNDLGNTSVTLTGANNEIRLNGDATNTVVAGSGSDIVAIGGNDDNLFGYKTKITLAGNSNIVNVDDVNATVSGGDSDNSIELGDGTNNVSVTGTGNYIEVRGGNNTINAGSGSATVQITGIDGTNGVAFVPDPDDAPVPSSPNDTVTIAGSGDLVQATYENVTVNGTGVTGGATIDLGNGNNAVNLGGNASTVSLGNGSNTVTLTGADNLVQVTSTKGTPGTDTVSVGSKDGNTVNLSFAGGSVTGSGGAKTTTTVTQDPTATTNVTV